MPWVEIKTGMRDPEGNEEVLREYLCDRRGCEKIAPHFLGAIPWIGIAMVCDDHIPSRRAGEFPR